MATRQHDHQGASDEHDATGPPGQAHRLTTATADAKLHATRRTDQAKVTANTRVLGWLAHPAATMEQLTHMAARVGVAVSPQAIDPRLTRTTASLLRTVLATMMEPVISRDSVALPIVPRFTGGRVHDGTTMVLPDVLAAQWRGCGGSTTTTLPPL